MDQLADQCNRKLLADLSRQTVIDLGVARDGSFRAVRRIGIDCVAAAFTLQLTPLLLQVTDQLMPLQVRGVPTWTERGTSSIRSASAAASGFGVGKGLPSSSRH